MTSVTLNFSVKLVQENCKPPPPPRCFKEVDINLVLDGSRSLGTFHLLKKYLKATHLKTTVIKNKPVDRFKVILKYFCQLKIYSGPKRFANLKAWVASLVQQFAIGADKE